MEPRASRYAVPLTTLLAGAQVELSEQVELVPVSTPPPAWTPDALRFADGAGGDADGD